MLRVSLLPVRLHKPIWNCEMAYQAWSELACAVLCVLNSPQIKHCRWWRLAVYCEQARFLFTLVRRFFANISSHSEIVRSTQNTAQQGR